MNDNNTEGFVVEHAYKAYARFEIQHKDLVKMGVYEAMRATSEEAKGIRTQSRDDDVRVVSIVLGECGSPASTGGILKHGEKISFLDAVFENWSFFSEYHSSRTETRLSMMISIEGNECITGGLYTLNNEELSENLKRWETWPQNKMPIGKMVVDEDYRISGGLH